MQQGSIHIRMLGSFEFEKDNIILNDGDNRSKKLWLLLAYLTYNRNTKVNQERLLSVLWDDTELSSNPANALKTLFHRARVQLEKFGENTGRSLFSCKKGEFFINPDAPYKLDLDDFENNVRLAKTSGSDEERFHYLNEAFMLYRGDFLSKFASESWVVPISTYYHNLFLEIVDSMLSIVEEQEDYETAIKICKRANTIERYEERFYRHLMRDYNSCGKFEETINIYRNLSDMLMTNFGVKPSGEVKKLYIDAMQSKQDYFTDITEIQQQLTSTDNLTPGALYCDYDFFCNIYQALARGIERNGSAIHLVVLTITDLNDKELPKRSLNTVVTNLKELMCGQLRHGDVVSMCSPSQFVVLLPNANRENAEMVSERVEKAFFRQYPHSPAKLNFIIQPMSPDQA
ncbi:MAG: hypothetical protein K6A30_04615 [Lachnospiraceae bacterium]|nr:hypothetical protein [Lachnospiraceae bacterium]